MLYRKINDLIKISNHYYKDDNIDITTGNGDDHVSKLDNVANY